VDAVVPIPFGAYPTACFRHYDYDPVYLNNYRKAAQDETRFRTYLKDFVLGVRHQDELLDRVGRERIEKIKADPRTGYAVGLDRR
jgi:glutaconate CoA-transferase subunit A